jgi:hypothetical protein
MDIFPSFQPSLPTALSQVSIMTVGSSPGRSRGMRLCPPACQCSLLEAQGQLDTGESSHRPHIWPGSFGPHGHRIDFCESQCFNHFSFRREKLLRTHYRRIANADGTYCQAYEGHLLLLLRLLARRRKWGL